MTNKQASQTVVANDADAEQKTSALNQINISLDELARTIKEYVAFRTPAMRMICVMLVSYLEAYFEDIFIDLATRAPGIIKSPEVDAKRLMEVGSIEELRSEVFRTWAKAQVRSGGPKNWCRRMREMGARSLDQAAIDAVQELYDVRNLIVHDRAMVSHAHARAYAQSGAVAGAKVTIAGKRLTDWLSASRRLVEGVESFWGSYGGRHNS
ncbi:hypothetical protein JQ615_33560 [Bradyrhizobium jicamae]|uniref:RiboL-PSP-HEPN domain-containing protein n=1 Tax=Bradyrhizobium jicamae TaxID=280332 RepID=A0ABS5FU67_9BRAD|nr:hypothetical protein [Bradyrhizobium jicamae]MBR0800307.1 hypothetical protein [Bradyrhizobium jicamae]